MYEKSVIKSLESLPNFDHNNLLEILENCTPYHLTTNLLDAMRRRFDTTTKDHFFGFSESYPLPFDRCWIDFNDTKVFKHVFGNLDRIQMGMIAENIYLGKKKKSSNIIRITPYFKTRNVWLPTGHIIFQNLTRDFTSDELRKLLGYVHPSDCEGNQKMLRKHYLKLIRSESEKTDAFVVDWFPQASARALHIDKRALTVLSMFMRTYHDRPVVEVPYQGLRKLSGPRTSKPQTSERRTVNIDLTKPKVKYIGAPKAEKKSESINTLNHLPFTFVRPHTKTFKEERPMFGIPKLHGEYQWSGHPRGNIAYKIEKSYMVM